MLLCFSYTVKANERLFSFDPPDCDNPVSLSNSIKEWGKTTFSKDGAKLISFGSKIKVWDLGMTMLDPTSLKRTHLIQEINFRASTGESGLLANPSLVYISKRKKIMSRDYNVSVVNINSGKREKYFVRTDLGVAKPNPSKNIVAFNDGEDIRIVDMDSQTILKRFNNVGYVFGFHPLTNEAIIRSHSRSKFKGIQLWDYENSWDIRTMLGDLGIRISDIVISDDGKKALVRGSGGWRDTVLKLINFTTGEVLIDKVNREHESDVMDQILMTPDARFAVASYHDVGNEKFKVWRLDTGEKIYEKEINGEIKSIAMSPTGQHFLINKKSVIKTPAVSHSVLYSLKNAHLCFSGSKNDVTSAELTAQLPSYVFLERVKARLGIGHQVSAKKVAPSLKYGSNTPQLRRYWALLHAYAIEAQLKEDGLSGKVVGLPINIKQLLIDSTRDISQSMNIPDDTILILNNFSLLEPYAPLIASLNEFINDTKYEIKLTNQQEAL